MIFSFGKDLSKEIVNELRKGGQQQIMDEGIRSVLMCADYILDIIISKKKVQ
jgi:hypothetical protein